MKTITSLAAALLAACSLVTARPTPHDSDIATISLPQTEQKSSTKPWLIFSMREQPFEEASLTFHLMDQTTRHTTECKTNLPMSGFEFCDDGKTSFIYGGVSFQFGETWLAIKRPDVPDCSASAAGVPATQTLGEEQQPGCQPRAATGHLDLPNNFWQQPGWNSWVHPESLDVHWQWAA